MSNKKHTYFLLVFILLQGMLYGQNLVSNAGFEGGWSCPEDFTKEPVKELIPHWLNPNKGTPDYFHSCSDSMAGVPDNFAGNMPAYEGDAYIGLILREVFIDSVPLRKVSREYITIELNKPLDFRKLYCFKLQYALADRSSFAVDALGVSFTREKLKAWDAGLLDAEPLVYNIPGHVMNNKNNWHEMCCVFRSRGREKFLTIGNFCPNVKTHYYQATDSLADSTFVYAYYYIDDVKLYEIENPFECGCQDKLSQGFDWLDENSQSFTDAYNNYRQQLEEEDMLVSAYGKGHKIKSGLYDESGQDNLSDYDNENNKTDNNGNNGDTENGEYDNKNDNDNKLSDSSKTNINGNDTGLENNNGKNKTGESNGNLTNYKSISGQIREGYLDEGEEKLIESLKNADTGFSIELPKIYFAFNQSELLPSSYPALEKLSKLLKEHNGLQIEIRGHTDNIGSNWYNKRLSNDRAISVYDFLIEAGIDESRLKYRGFGNKVPVADNDTEEGRQLNRRVEIKVISNQ